MPTHRSTAILSPLLALAVCAAGCGGSNQAELERLRREQEALRAEVERLRRAEPETPPELLAYFQNDPARSTLAGLVPGDTVAQARSLFGNEARTRTWDSEGHPITQYEWELTAGVMVRTNATAEGRLVKVAVVLVRPEAVRIPTLAGLTLGGDTFSSIQQKFGEAVVTDLHIWGAQGLYTVAQRVPLADTKWRFEFAYQLPADLGPGQRDRIEDEVARRRNPAVLAPLIGDRAPYMVGLEEVP